LTANELSAVMIRLPAAARSPGNAHGRQGQDRAYAENVSSITVKLRRANVRKRAGVLASRNESGKLSLRLTEGCVGVAKKV